MAEKKKVGDVIDDMMAGGKGGADTSADAAVANIKKIVASLTSSTTEMSKQLTALQATVKSGNIAGLAKNIDALSVKTSNSITDSLTKLFNTFEIVATTTIGLGAQTLAKTRTAVGSFNTELTTFQSNIKSSLGEANSRFKKDVSGSVGATSKEIGNSIRTTLDTLSRDLTKQTKLSIESVKDSVDSGGGGEGSSMSIGGMIWGKVKSALAGLDNALAAVINIGTSSLSRAQEGMAGLSGAVNAFGGMIHDVLSEVSKLTGIKTIGAMGDLTQQIISTAMAIYKFQFEINLASQKTKYRAEAQVGGGALSEERGAQAVKTMRSMWGNFSMEEATAWGNAMIDQGAPLESNLKSRMVRVGKSMSIDPGEMGQILDQFLTLTNSAQAAGDMMSVSFRAARVAAESVGMSANKVQKFIQDAATGARYLNVDMKTVSTTMQSLAANQEKFRAAGVSIREDGGKILGELTGGSRKFSDAMHVFFGTKGGTEGSPIEGLVKSKFGTTFASTLKSTSGGGFSATAGTSGDMMVQRLDVMKSAMMEASKNAASDAERLVIQQKVAEETFGMSEESAKVMAMQDRSEIKKLADNPKLADEFKSEKEIMSDLKTMDAVNLGIQRQMAMLAAQQVRSMLSVATNTAIMAAQAAGVDTKKMGLESNVTNALKETISSGLNTMAAMKKITGGVLESVDPKGMKTFTDLQVAMLNKISSSPEAQKKQQGGYVLPALAGRNVYSTVEDGRPELFHSGSGSNTLFAPGESGKIFNASETMGTFKKGLGGGGGEGGGAPTVNRSGSGEQTILNITINAGTLDKSSFAKLLETEVLNHIYR